MRLEEKPREGISAIERLPSSLKPQASSLKPEGVRRRAGASASRNERDPSRMKALGALVLGAVFAVSFVFPPSGFGLSTCAFRNAFGIPCPGCGMTRSFAALSQGQVALAFRMHWVGPFMYAGLALYMVKWAIEALLRRRVLARAEDRLRLPVLWSLLAAMLVTWVIRLATGMAN